MSTNARLTNGLYHETESLKLEKSVVSTQNCCSMEGRRPR